MTEDDDSWYPRRRWPAPARWAPIGTPPDWSLESPDEDGTLDGGSFVLRRQARDLLGWTGRELAIVPALQLIHPDDRRAVAAIAPRRCGENPFVPFEIRIVSRDSRYWWTRWHLTARHDGAPVAVSDCLLRPDPDIAPPIGVWEWNADANAVAWSDQLLEMFGFRADAPDTYMRALDVVLPEDRP